MKPLKQHLFSMAKRIENDLVKLKQRGVWHLLLGVWLSRGTALIQRFLLARILGAELVGYIAVATTWFELLRLPAGAGAFTVVNKLVAESATQREKVTAVSTIVLITLAISTAIGLIFAGIFYLYPSLSNPTAALLLSVLCLLLPAVVCSEVLSSTLMGSKRFKTVAGISVGLSGWVLVVSIPMCYLWGLRGWLINQVVWLLASALIHLWLLRDHLRWQFSRVVGAKLFRIGIFSMLHQILGVLLLRMDTLMLSRLTDDSAAIGVYNTASLLALQVMLIPGTIIQSAFPYIAQNSERIQFLREKYREVSRKLMVGSLALFLLIVVLAPLIMGIFGETFRSGAHLLRILMLGFVFRSLYVWDNAMMDALGRTDLSLASGFLAALGGLMISWVVISRYGAVGAAWGTTISMFLSFVIRKIFVSRFILYRNSAA
jgi:O-antigen/teichoic acid export membrane protein